MKVTISVGGKWHAFHLAEQLQKRGFLHKIITSYPFFKLKKENVDKGKIVSIFAPEIMGRAMRKIPLFKDKMPTVYWQAMLFDHLAKGKIDKCDIFVGWSSFALHSMRVAKSYGAITIVERCSSHIQYQQEILEEEFQRYSLKGNPVDPRIIEKELKEYQEADYISVPSGFVYKSFLKKGIEENKLLKVPYGVDLTDFRQVPKKDNVFRVVFVGGLSLRKGIHYLLKAASELSLSNFELVLIGGLADDAKPFLEKYDGIYKYIGKVPHRELYQYYSRASVFILPSIEEGLSMVIAEAMACGLPVIVSENTGGQEIVRDGKDGFIIPIRDVEAIKEKILYFYEHEDERQAMGASAREHIKQFTWDRYGEKVVETYGKILGKG